MRFVTLHCAFCRGNFERSKYQSDEAKKFGWKQFCSLKCLASLKLQGKQLVCVNTGCGKSFYRPLKEIKKVQNNFCSQTCSAIFNNKLRSESRLKIYCAYQECNLIISRDRKYCSRLHGGLARRVPKEEYRKRFINHIKAFFKKHSRIPVKREMYGAYKEARIFFGSWNKAIIAAGLDPNPVKFANKYIARDGHFCDSMAEKIIDDWLLENKINHERNVPYPVMKKLTADFVIRKTWVEYFGLAGVLPDYDLLIKLKQRLANKHKLNLVSIYPKDLFPRNKLAEILKVV